MNKSSFAFIFILSFLFILTSIQSYSKSSIHAENIIRQGDGHSMGLNGLTSIQMDSIRKNGMMAKMVSPSGKFTIQYDTIDTKFFSNAVDMADANYNGYPDYVDSVAFYFDWTYRKEVEEYGYKSPTPEPGGYDETYDIYLIELGPEGQYGLTYPSQFINHNPAKIYPCYYSYIVIDNNFSQYDSVETKYGKMPTYEEYGMAALKATAAHEFYHAIQNMYGHTNDPLLHEMLSVMMEVRLNPESKDYYQYAKDFFYNYNKYPFGRGSEANSGYRYGIFGIALIKKYGDDLFLDFWENVFEGKNPYQSLDMVLNDRGSSFDQEWTAFLESLYYTGKRAIPGKSLDNAADFPLIKFFNTDMDYSEPCFARTGYLDSYEIRAYRVFLPGKDFDSEDTLDMIISNRGLSYAVNRLNPDTEFDITVSKTKNDLPNQLGSSDYYYGVNPGTDELIALLFHTTGAPTDRLAHPFPNPFDKREDDNIFFPVPEDTKLQEVVLLRVFDINMSEIYGEKHLVEVNNGHRGVYWKNIPNDISSGVYIFSVESGDKKKLGKFAIKR